MCAGHLEKLQPGEEVEWRERPIGIIAKPGLELRNKLDAIPRGEDEALGRQQNGLWVQRVESQKKHHNHQGVKENRQPTESPEEHRWDMRVEETKDPVVTPGQGNDKLLAVTLRIEAERNQSERGEC